MVRTRLSSLVSSVFAVAAVFQLMCWQISTVSPKLETKIFMELSLFTTVNPHRNLEELKTLVDHHAKYFQSLEAFWVQQCGNLSYHCQVVQRLLLHKSCC